MEIMIRADKLCKAYAGAKAVDNVSFTVGRGEVFGLLGANGAGKSTTIECILGTKKADSGTVSILGMNSRAERKKVFERVGVQFQDCSYQDKITVAELCRVTCSLYRTALDYSVLLEQFGLTEKKKSSVGELSGGLRQRLFVVLALIPDPEVIFLDELTTGLDTKARREVLKHLAGLKAKGRAMLVTSHYMDEVEALCDRILILKKGKSVFEGTVREAVEASPCSEFEDAYLWHSGEEENNYESA